MMTIFPYWADAVRQGILLYVALMPISHALSTCSLPFAEKQLQHISKDLL